MWYKLDVAPPPAGQWFAPLALRVASGNLASGKETMRSEVVRVRLQPKEKEALATLCGEERTASDVRRLRGTNEDPRVFLSGVFWLRTNVDLMPRISCRKQKGTSRGV